MNVLADFLNLLVFKIWQSKQYTFYSIYMNCIVTAYYPVRTGKHSQNDYKEWYTNFFTCVTAPIICFCAKEMEDEFRSIMKENVTLVIRDFHSFQMMSKDQMAKWYEWYKSDPEILIHSPELYAVWAAKQEFVLEAMKLVKYSIYIWCDIGCFRFRRPGGFQNTSNYILPGKITCLDIANTIGGTVLAGDIDAWTNFSKKYLDELAQNIHGKDQDIYKRILNSENANIIQPNQIYGDPWFYLTYIFSY